MGIFTIFKKTPTVAQQTAIGKGLSMFGISTPAPKPLTLGQKLGNFAGNLFSGGLGGGNPQISDAANAAVNIIPGMPPEAKKPTSQFIVIAVVGFIALLAFMGIFKRKK